MAKKSTKKRGTMGVYLDMYGVSDMVNKMDRALGGVEEPLARAYKAGMAYPESVMEDWMAVQHRRTGRTASSFRDGRLVWQKDGTGVYEYGFKKDEGGLPALFLEYGTPRIKPEFVMWYAIHDNLDVIAMRLENELKLIMKEKGLS